MKYIALIFILGIFEVIVISKLHGILGLNDVVVLYVVTTIFGALVASVFFSKFKAQKNNATFGKKFQKRIREDRVTKTDKMKMTSLVYVATYIFGCILVAIPGLITDFIGMLLLLPPISNFVANKYGESGFGLYANNK